MPGIRPEARPLRFEDLSTTQQEATERVAQSLLSALDDLERVRAEAGNTNVLKDLDLYRSSRIMFVSGEPGSGKTTAYLTLKHVLAAKDHGIKDEKKSASLLGLRKKAGQLVWLEALDLEPAADSTNFLAALLVRIENATVKRRPARNPERDRKPGLLEPRDAIQDFRRLQNDVVLAWDGNVPQRAEHIDPDVYSQEVLRAEKARLNIKNRLQETLEVLVEQEKQEEVLFVLPVDDFYLNPASSLKFLRLLRMISVPRLFILVLGDLDVVEELFYQDMLGQLVAIAGERTFQVEPRQQKILSPRARALASHALRKLIPLAQRSRLEPMEKLQALKFSPERLWLREPQRSALNDSGRRESEAVELQAHLENLPVHVPLASVWKRDDCKMNPQKFYDFLLLRGDSEATGPYTYSGLAILDLPPREVVDLWWSVANTLSSRLLEPGDHWRGTIEVVVEQTLEALAGQTYLGVEKLEKCGEAIQGTPYYMRLFETSVLEMSLDKTVRSRRLPLTNGTTLTISRHPGWVLRPLSQESTEEGASGQSSAGKGGIDYLPPRPSAWFTVLHDLMALSGQDLVRGKSLVPDPFELAWVSISGPDLRRSICWPTPKWPSFWHFDRLAFFWNKVVDSLGEKASGGKGPSPENQAAWLAYNWIRAITGILLEDRFDLDGKPSDFTVSEKAWTELAGKTEQLLSGMVDLEYAYSYSWLSDWLLHLGVFLDERFALPKDAINAFWRNSALKTWWEKADKEISSIRDQFFIAENGEKAKSVVSGSSEGGTH